MVVAKRMKKGQQQQRQQRTMRLDQPTKQSGLRQQVRMRTKLVMGRALVSKQTDNMARQSSLRTLRGRFQSYVGAKDIKRDARRYLYCDTNRDGGGREEGGGA